MFGAIDISTSGMVAQRIRMNTIAMNIAMMDVVETPEGGPYRRRAVDFAAGANPDDRDGRGVHVARIRQEDVFRYEHDENHPYADADGNVKLPGIDYFTEAVNGMEAQRAYEANLTAIEVSKNMLNSALRLLA